MISARASDTKAAFARLAARAAALGEAAAERRARARRADPSRWREARLLWPLFARNR